MSNSRANNKRATQLIEENVLSGIFNHPHLFEYTKGRLTTANFLNQAYKQVFEAICTCAANGSDIDIANISEAMYEAHGVDAPTIVLPNLFWTPVSKDMAITSMDSLSERTAGASGIAQTAGTDDLDNWTPSTKGLPTLSEMAMPGIVGEFVRLATQASEADPAAITATFLTRFGAEIYGHEPQTGPFHMVGDCKHMPRLFVVIVGDSSKARKGTSAHPVKKLFTFEALDYTVAATTPGPLSSGEGLVFAVRDEMNIWQPSRRPGEEGRWIVTDPGVSDKRLFVLDEELGAALHSTNRKGNTLSTTVRCLWDSGDVSPITKGDRISTTGAHVCIVTHITIAELELLLDRVQAFNGFANRFLWVFSRRRGFVPHPHPMPEDQVRELRGEVLRLIRLAQGRGEIPMDAKACAMWSDAYQELSRAYPGLSGCVINRSEAQTRRLALIYALLDGQDHINAEHLRSALTFWEYCRDSALLIFGQHESDPAAEKVLNALREGPQTTSELHKKLSNHYTSDSLKATLQNLVKHGVILPTQERTGGRSKIKFSLREKSEISEKSSATPDLNSLNSLNSQNGRSNQATSDDLDDKERMSHLQQ
jgi:hypothetical protein